MKGKYVDTNFGKPSILGKTPLQTIINQLVVRQPIAFKSERSNSSKTRFTSQVGVSTIQSLNRFCLQEKDKLNTNPRVSTSTGVTYRTSVSRPQLRSTQLKDKVVKNNSQVKFKKTKVEDHHRISSFSNTKSVTTYNDSLKSKTSNVNVLCANCGKCVFNLNHDACVSKFINDVNARTKKPQVVPISARKPKRQTNQYVATPHKKTVASESTIQKFKNYFRMLYIATPHKKTVASESTIHPPLILLQIKYLGKAKKSSFKTKTVPSSKGRLHLLHMDLCGLMRVESINGKKYILMIVDDYSRYMWTHFLRSKDETPEVLIGFLKLIQRGLQAQVITVCTDRGTEFLNKTLHAYFTEEGIEHQNLTA
ncbi:retrovirus-related pol polyprotein from transposon TNT 1-94 [Tanacetum coccineum]|uniref:Retrovirus-related pol polyprotein from transposon TNT 1-94 n=1 Tax=Tanacetum coccineum TaxID=301880 RepID=A0ABQ4Z5D1_9ASTR